MILSVWKNTEDLERITDGLIDRRQIFRALKQDSIGAEAQPPASKRFLQGHLRSLK